MRPVRILLLLMVMGCFASCHSRPKPPEKSSADAPVTKTRDAAAPLRHVFRGQAMSRADSTRIYAMVATGIDQSAREELLHLIDEHEAKVNARTAQIQNNAPDLLNEAGRMSGEFAAASDNWFAKNPTAESAINRAAALLDDIIDVLGNDWPRLLTAAERAGLPDEKRKEARVVIQAHYDELFRAYRRFEGRKQRSARAFETDPDFIEAPGIMADLVIERLQIAKSLRDQLRDLLPAERRDQLDDEIGKVSRSVVQKTGGTQW
jgi:hypothetical protein